MVYFGLMNKKRVTNKQSNMKFCMNVNGPLHLWFRYLSFSRALNFDVHVCYRAYNQTVKIGVFFFTIYTAAAAAASVVCTRNIL